MADVAPKLVAQVDMRAGRELVPVRREATLEQWAESINDHFDKVERSEGTASRHRIRAGAELIKVRGLIPHGEWEDWCKANIRRSLGDIRKVMKLAGADDPDAAIEKERSDDAERKRLVRANRADVRAISDPVVEQPKVLRGRALDKLLAARTFPNPDFKVAPEALMTHYNKFYLEISEYFLHSLVPRFMAFVTANQDSLLTDSEVVNSLHSLVDGIEAECRDMRESLYRFSES
jgi:hypothetical protein